MSAKLLVFVQPAAQDTLLGFPYQVGQYLADEEPSELTLKLTIHLADHDDATSAQEQFLNTNRQVVAYATLPDLQLK